jgi:PAS domain S-box-containing protein
VGNWVPSIVQRASQWWARRTLAQRFATLTAILIAGGAIIQGAVLIGVASQVVGSFERERVEQRLDKASAQLTSRVTEFRKIPRILEGTPPIDRIAALSTAEKPRLGESLDAWLRRLGIIFRSILEANPDLTQARLIGVADGGRELVRVNRIGDKIEIVDKANLQRKGQRPYFREIAKLKPGEIYLSSIDANVENGRTVRPYQTTIRAGTPIFTENNKLFGIIVANADAAVWLRSMSELTDVTGTGGRFLVANQNGDYVYRSDGGPLFASHDGSTRSFKHDWPQLSALFGPGTMTSEAVRNGNQFVAAHRVAYNPTRPDEFLVLTTEVNADAVFGDTLSFALLGTAVALAMAIIGLIAAYFVSRPLRDLMGAAKQIAAGKLDVGELARTGRGVDIGELGEALRIMKDAVESRDASLRKSEAHLQAIVDNTIDGLITITSKGIILRYNRGCEEIFGYTTDEALGRNVSMLMPKPDSDRHDGYLRRYAQTGERRFIGARREATGLHKNGHKIDLEVAIAEIKVGDEVLFSGIVRDITERKKIDKIKSEFVSTVTHELRTPLTSIMGSLGLLQAGSLGELPEKSKRMVNLAYDNGARLVNLINDILDIDKIEAGHLIFKRRRKKLAGLLKLSVEQNALYAKEHGARIVLEDVPDDIILDTDPHRFQQVMGNLLSNAAKFSPQDGKVTVSAKMMGSAVRISVADNGPGIPPEFEDHVFEKFAQGDSSDTRKKGGTGLGMSIAKAIVERLGGRIAFKTKVGAGTVFYFDLPAERGGASTTGSGDEGQRHVVYVNRQSSAEDGLARVLHIEDDADTCAVVAQALDNVAVVTCVPSAEEARELLIKQSFDLIILDMLLPNENGDSVLRLLQERSMPAPPVLVFSGLELAVERWPPVTRALVKSRTDIVTLRRHVLELLRREPPELKRSA